MEGGLQCQHLIEALRPALALSPSHPQIDFTIENSLGDAPSC
jgi:hypothetical protein